MGTLQVGGTTLGVKNTVTNKVDLSNVGDVTLTSSANIKGAINASGDAPIYACRAWVNFNGTGTVAIRDSGNVSSITDNGTGDYTVNFTTAMPDANYTVTGSNVGSTGSYYSFLASGGSSPTVNGFRFSIVHRNDDIGLVDLSHLNVQVIA